MGTILISTGFLLQIYKLEPNIDRSPILKIYFNSIGKLTPTFILLILFIFSIFILAGPKELFLSFILMGILIISSALILPLFLRFVLSYIIFSFAFSKLFSIIINVIVYLFTAAFGPILNVIFTFLG